MTDFAVVGLGYVGLPLVVAASRRGLRCTGIDRSVRIVDGLMSGRSHVDDITNDEVEELLGAGFVATADPSALAGCPVVVICVPTPLSSDGGPDLVAVRSAAESIVPSLTHGCLVILESTTWPGTTEEVLRPILETSGLKAGVDFHLAYSPERIDPGNPTFGVENTPKVVGGLTPSCRDKAADFYGNFVQDVVLAKGTREAEMAKLLENTYRQINIALVNEMAKFSHELDIDIWNVIDCASTKPFGFQRFTPGPGVGGHCIPIDPSYLSHRVETQLGYPFRFVELAQEINRSMPKYVASRAQSLLNDRERAVRGSRILLLGITYKAGIADQRESPAIPLGQELAALGAHVMFDDPFVEEWNLMDGCKLRRVDDLEAAIGAADLVIHLQANARYRSELFQSVEAPVLDARGVLVGPSVQRL